MAILRLCIVPTKVLINGKHKVRISLAHNNGKLVFGKYKTFGQCYSVVSHKMEEFAKIAGIEKRVIYYSARKSFVQHGFEPRISLEIPEYCIGQSMKTNRPIFNYFRVMRKHADDTIKK